jgi:UDP-glucose 4-epimerase
MIVVTGSEGFVGREVCRQLKERGLVFKGLDIANGDDVRKCKIPKATAYIHLAAEPLVPESIKRPRETWDINVDGTLAVLDACRTYRAKIVFASSSQATADSENPYGLQKHQSEQIINMYQDLYGVRHCIFKIYNIFGDGDHGVIGAFLTAREKNQPLILNGGQQRRDFIHVSTVAQKLIEGIKQEGVHYLGSGENISVKEIADLISDNQIIKPAPIGEPMELLCPVRTETMSVREYLSNKELI